MIWRLSHRADPEARAIADRHYNRQKPGTPQFVPPGRCLVLLAKEGSALWVTSWPFAEYVKHKWAGAWICSCFRRESGPEASEMIRDAVSATRAKYPDVPPLGMVTFLDRQKVAPIWRRNRKTWGYTWLKAGFKFVGWTKAKLMVFQMLPENMPEAKAIENPTEVQRGDSQ